MYTRRLSNLMMATAILGAFIAGILFDERYNEPFAAYLFITYSAGIGLWLTFRRRKAREAKAKEQKQDSSK